MIPADDEEDVLDEDNSREADTDCDCDAEGEVVGCKECMSEDVSSSLVSSSEKI